MAVPVKDCHAMTSYYEKLYKKKYGRAPVVNRNTARWSWDSILQGMPADEVKSLLDYYFQMDSANAHSLQWFFYNYEKLVVGRQEELNDNDHRARLRRESEERAREWREKFGNQGITSN